MLSAGFFLLYSNILIRISKVILLRFVPRPITRPCWKGIPCIGPPTLDLKQFAKWRISTPTKKVSVISLKIWVWFFETPKILKNEYRISDLENYVSIALTFEFERLMCLPLVMLTYGLSFLFSEKQIVSSLSKVELVRRLKEIRALKPSLVVGMVRANTV